MTANNKALILRPGYLVSLKTSIDGGVHYTRTDLKEGEAGDGDTKVEEWKTRKVVDDAKEHDAASKVRSKARGLIAKVCSSSAFGLICPLSREADLDAAIAEAREGIAKFNASAKTVSVQLYAIKGKIAENDTEAARGVAAELREIMDAMRDGVAGVDIEAIRAAADRGRAMAKMLDEKSGEVVNAAVDEARAVARELTKKLTKKAADTAAYVQTLKLDAIRTARAAFVDVGEAEEVAPTPSASGRAIDIGNEDEREAAGA